MRRFGAATGTPKRHILGESAANVLRRGAVKNSPPRRGCPGKRANQHHDWEGEAALPARAARLTIIKRLAQSGNPIDKGPALLGRGRSTVANAAKKARAGASPPKRDGEMPMLLPVRQLCQLGRYMDGM